jgi:uncharacterized membrane protein
MSSMSGKSGKSGKSTMSSKSSVGAVQQQMDHSRQHIYRPADLGEKAADLITGFVGSWLFVAIHGVWFLTWIVVRPEPFPFGLLTLLVSLEAIFLSTFVMMSQNRQAAKDALRDNHEATEVDMLFQINQTQLEILRVLRQELCPAENAGHVAGLMKSADHKPEAARSPAGQPVGAVPARATAGQARTGQRRRGR